MCSTALRAQVVACEPLLGSGSGGNHCDEPGGVPSELAGDLQAGLHGTFGQFAAIDRSGKVSEHGVLPVAGVGSRHTRDNTGGDIDAHQAPSLAGPAWHPAQPG